MSGDTNIEWAEKVWNPVTGCTKVSDGCRNCYAERMSKRLAGRAGYPEDGFNVTLHPAKLEEPLRWKKPARIFVCSMGDLFHEDVPDEFLDEVFAVMAAASQHTFLVLTKRPERMRDYLCKAMRDEDCNYDGWYAAIERRGVPDAPPLENVFCGVSVEDQETADERIPLLLQTPAAKRFVSYEPALGPVDIRPFVWTDMNNNIVNGVGINKLDWVIMGGESGPGARPMHPDWARSVRDQCQAAGVPFFFKQWGEWLHESQLKDNKQLEHDDFYELADRDFIFARVGKKAAGCLLDGKEHKERA